MYTGTLISDLMAMVDRVEANAEQQTNHGRTARDFHDADSRSRRLNGLSWGRHNGGSGSNDAGRDSAVERRSLWTGTPEIYFSKAIDNSRLIKVEDPRRNREMKQFGTALAVLFLLVFHLCLAAPQGDRVRLPDRICQAGTLRVDRDESRPASGRCFSARS